MVCGDQLDENFAFGGIGEADHCAGFLLAGRHANPLKDGKHTGIRSQTLDQGLEQVSGLIEGESDGQLEGAGHHAVIGDGDVFPAQAGRDSEDRDQEGREEDQEDGFRSTQGLPHQTLVARHDQGCARGRDHRADQMCRHHGYKGQGQDEGSHQRGAHRDAQRREQSGGDAVGKEEWDEDDQGGEGRAGDGSGHFPGAVFSGLGRRFPHFEVSVDVFEDDDGIVDQHADAQSKAAEGHHIERILQKIHGNEGHQHRQGDGQPDGQQERQALEENIENGHGEEATQDKISRDGGDRFVDEFGLIEDRFQFDVARQQGTNSFDLRVDLGQNRDGIAA